MQNVSAAPNAHQTKEKDSDLCRPSKDGDLGKARAPSEPQSNIFVLRKMVEEVFTVLYSKQHLHSAPPLTSSPTLRQPKPSLTGQAL